MTSSQSDSEPRGTQRGYALAPENIVAAVALLPLGEQFEVLNRLVEHFEQGEGVERATLVEAVESYGR